MIGKDRENTNYKQHPGPSRYVSLRRLLEEFPFLGFLLAPFALGNLVHYFLMASYLAVRLPASGCCMWILRETLRLLGRSV